MLRNYKLKKTQTERPNKPSDIIIYLGTLRKYGYSWSNMIWL